MDGWIIYHGNTTLYLTVGGAIGHFKSPSTEPKPWNTDQAQFHSAPPCGHVCPVNRCHPYGWTQGPEVFSSPQSQTDNIRGCFLSIWKRIYSVWLPCTAHEITIPVSSKTDVSPFSRLANKPDRFQTFAKPAGLLLFFPVLNLCKIKTSWDKLRCGYCVSLEGLECSRRCISEAKRNSGA